MRAILMSLVPLAAKAWVAAVMAEVVRKARRVGMAGK
jgi:hypothetical protein